VQNATMILYVVTKILILNAGSFQSFSRCI
jgi:hypothetical protein